ncbi:DUF4345 domain-containing protein [Streptomyces sp. CB01635]|uniref:DUF4345 domain-containing protein n=2 Tax=unclassified Streptomyces TaxID=2593676 RepID=UPI003FA3DB9E
MGIACVAIGLYHLVLGIASVPGEGSTGATVDSRERFYNAIIFGYGLAWIWAAPQSPIPSTAVRWLSGVFLLRGVGRVLSLAVHGWPHWLQVPLSALELALPPLSPGRRAWSPDGCAHGPDARSARRRRHG